MTSTSPYGSWRSPISAASLADSGHPVSGGAFVGDEVWWIELRPSEGGRLAIRRTEPDGAIVDVLPAPWNARSRVHEYGGGAWAASDDGTVVFVEFTDQRLYRLDPGSVDPVPLTPEAGGFRFGELGLRGSEVIAVRETHLDGQVTRDIVAVPIRGGEADDPSVIRSIVSGAHFLAYPRFSPDGSRLAFIAWDHPQMPWDGTELRVARLDETGVAASVAVLAGGQAESILQPEWDGADALTLVSDRSGWWNLERLALGGDRTTLKPESAEYADALWILGTRWRTTLDDGRILAVRISGHDGLVIIDPVTGEATPVAQPLTSLGLGPRRGSRVLLTGGSSTLAPGLRVLDLASGRLDVVRLSTGDLPDAAYLPIARPHTFVGTREVHAIVYPPRNPDFEAPAGELPPFIAFVHGGPTSRVAAIVNPTIAYFTSRGIGVVDVNYGGSTGYGREYRDRLRGQWGIVDVEDTIAAVQGLADSGDADRARLAIRGGSAGGWTVLASLTSSDVFAAGTSYFGVAELTQFALDTHDFESRYLDGLIGPLPAAADLYASRAPLNNVDRLSTPVLLLQGLDDPIVPPSQAEMFRDALLAKGIPHAYVAYPGESHGFRRAATIVHATESELSFYGQVCGFTPVDVPTLPLTRPAR